jgi:hypothetical protein
MGPQCLTMKLRGILPENPAALQRISITLSHYHRLAAESIGALLDPTSEGAKKSRLCFRRSLGHRLALAAASTWVANKRASRQEMQLSALLAIQADGPSPHTCVFGCYAFELTYRACNTAKKPKMGEVWREAMTAQREVPDCAKDSQVALTLGVFRPASVSERADTPFPFGVLGASSVTD